MAHFKVAVLQQSPHVFLQGHQSQQIGHGGSGFTHCLSHFLLGELKLLLQALQRRRFFNRD